METALIAGSGLRFKCQILDARSGEEVLTWDGVFRAIEEAAPELVYLQSVIFNRLGAVADIMPISNKPVFRGRWTESDDTTLRNCVRDGWTNQAIARRLGRTELACSKRMSRIGIKRIQEYQLGKKYSN
jgi:hypothetical protein